MIELLHFIRKLAKKIGRNDDIWWGSSIAVGQLGGLYYKKNIYLLLTQYWGGGGGGGEF